MSSIGQPRVVISLSTNPVRIMSLEPTLHSLCTQSLRADRVYLHLPYIHRRFPEQPFTVPLFFANFSHCVHVSFTIDDGPATKLLGALTMEADPHTMIVVVDDDKVYSREMLSGLVRAAQQRPDAAIGFAGISVTRGAFCFHPSCGSAALHPVAVLEGYASVLYRRRSIGPADAVIQMVRAAPRSCQLGDDVLLSNWLSRRGVPRLRLFSKALNQWNVVTGGYEDDTALHNLRSGGRQRPRKTFHPEEFRKYRPCFLSGAASHAEQDSHAMIKGNDVSACARACHRFNRSSMCDDSHRRAACEANDWAEEVHKSIRLKALSWLARPPREEVQASVARLQREVRAVAAPLGREIYVTVVVNDEESDQVPGLLALAATLVETGATRPLLVLLVGPASPAISRAAACLKFTVISVSRIEDVGPNRNIPSQLRNKDSLNKLHAFGVPAERVIFLDASTLLLRNIDELFGQPGPAEVAAVPDNGHSCPGNFRRCRTTLAKGDNFNDGVMVLRPSASLFQDLFSERWTTDSKYDWGSQGFLNAFFKARTSRYRGVDELPTRYNTFAQEERLNPSNFSLSETSVLHFAGLKPWSRRAQIGEQSLGAYDRAMASYRKRCPATHSTRSRSAATANEDRRSQRLRGDIAMAKRAGAAGRSPGKIHMRDAYRYGAQ